jgi:hypothetical protein
MGIFCRDQAELFDGLAAATDGGGDALVAIGLDAIGIGMQHQEADLAAGSGGACPENNPRGRRGTPRPRPAGAEAARTAQRPGLILAASDAVGTLGGIHAASMARAAAAVW